MEKKNMAKIILGRIGTILFFASYIPYLYIIICSVEQKINFCPHCDFITVSTVLPYFGKLSGVVCVDTSVIPDFSPCRILSETALTSSRPRQRFILFCDIILSQSFWFVNGKISFYTYFYSIYKNIKPLCNYIYRFPHRCPDTVPLRQIPEQIRIFPLLFLKLHFRKDKFQLSFGYQASS